MLLLLPLPFAATHWLAAVRSNRHTCVGIASVLAVLQSPKCVDFVALPCCGHTRPGPAVG